MTEPRSQNDDDATATERWLAAAQADADRRGMPELKPLLQGLAVSTRVLRQADWNDQADADATPIAPVADPS